MRTFTTANVVPERRAAYWNAIYEQFAPMRVQPSGDKPFDAELRLGRIGPLDIAFVHSDGARAERTSDHCARAAERQLAIMLFLQGEGVWSHCGQEGPIANGDILLSDNTRPIFCRFERSVTGITIRAPERVLHAYLPFADDLCGTRLPADGGMVRAAASIARCLAEPAPSAAATEYGVVMASHFLGVLATSCAMLRGRAAPTNSVAAFRKARARQYIETNLAAPDLGPHRVAAALQISPRYLRVLMAEDGETASALILRRRLEECARQLASPVWGDRTITDIAFSWGFNSTAHFARVFRERFGMSPREYRRQAITPACRADPAFAARALS